LHPVFLTLHPVFLTLHPEQPHRTLLGHATIRVLDHPKWQALLEAACAPGAFFASLGAIYDLFLAFGLGQGRGTQRRWWQRPLRPAPMTSTDKKVAALKDGTALVFCPRKLASNIKRYANGHTRAKPARGAPEGLAALLAAAREVGKAKPARGASEGLAALLAAAREVGKRDGCSRADLSFILN